MSVILQSEASKEIDDPIVIRLYDDEPQRFAEGGLAQAAQAVRGAGQGDDEVLLHVTPEEFEQLKGEWGEPSINPITGLPQYGGLLKRLGKNVKRALKNPLVQKLAPLALNMFLPGVGGLIGSSLFGAASAKASGGNPLLGGLMGGAGRFLSGVGGGGGATSNIMPGETGGMPTGAGPGSGILGKLKGFFTNDAGKPAWGKIAGVGAGALGLLGSMQGAGHSEGSPVAPPSTPPLARLPFNRTVTGLPNEEAYRTYGTTGGEHQFFDNNAVPMIPQTPMRAGGHYILGAGSGRSDDIDAKLSNNEYVMDAETVALLGDGSPDEGARRLDELRMNLRRHKGKQLSKGKFSTAAKRPEEYLAKGGRIKRPRYIIEALRTEPSMDIKGKTLDEILYEDVGEGPWTSRRDAERFLEAEVGAPGARVRKKAKGGRMRGHTSFQSGDKSTAYRGYYITHNMIHDKFYLKKDGAHTGPELNSLDDAKRYVDELAEIDMPHKAKGGHVRRPPQGATYATHPEFGRVWVDRFSSGDGTAIIKIGGGMRAKSKKVPLSELDFGALDDVPHKAKGGRIRGDGIRRVIEGGLGPKTDAERKAELESVQRFIKAYREANPRPERKLKVVKAKGGAVENMTRFADELEQAIQAGNSDRITQIAAQMDTLSPKSSGFFTEGFAKGGSAKNLFEKFMERMQAQSRSEVPVDQVIEELRRLNPESNVLRSHDASVRSKLTRRQPLQGEELLRLLEKGR